MRALPTRFSLRPRYVLTDQTCPICSGEDETTIHALWSCPYAGSVWALAPGKFQKMPLSVPDFFSLTGRIFNDLPRELVELWAVTSWAIWYTRTKLSMTTFSLRLRIHWIWLSGFSMTSNESLPCSD
ncbi:putative ribonuclease h protein [Fagus crenata]